LHLLLWQRAGADLCAQRQFYESGIVLHVPPKDSTRTFHARTRRWSFPTTRRWDGQGRTRFHNEVWDLTLFERDTEVGLDLWAYMQRSRFKTGEEPFNFLGLVMLNGKAGARIGYQEHSNLQKLPGQA